MYPGETASQELTSDIANSLIYLYSCLTDNNFEDN